MRGCSHLSWNLGKWGTQGGDSHSKYTCLCLSLSWPVFPEPLGTHVGTLHAIIPWLFQRQFLDLHLPCVERIEAARPVHLCDEMLASTGKMDGAWHQHPTHNYGTAPAAYPRCKRHRCTLSSKDSPLNHGAPKILVALVRQSGCGEQRLRCGVLSHPSLEGRNQASFQGHHMS